MVLVLLKKTVLLSRFVSVGIKLQSRDVTATQHGSQFCSKVKIHEFSISRPLCFQHHFSIQMAACLNVQKVTLNCSLTQLLKIGLIIVLANFKIQTSVRTCYGLIHLREKEIFP